MNMERLQHNIWIGIRSLLLLILVNSLLRGQISQNASTLTAPPPTPAQLVNVGVVGQQGIKSYFYYVIVRYPIGNSLQSAPGIVITANDTLTTSNYNLISWASLPNAIGYDLIRLTTPVFQNPCTTCLIASNTTATNIRDQSNTTLGSYTLVSAPAATYSETLNNVNNVFPTVVEDAIPLTQIKPTGNINIDNSVANKTTPIKTVSVLPSSCTGTEQVYYTAAATGTKIYACENGVFVVQGGGSGSGNGNVLCTAASGSGVVTPTMTACDNLSFGVTGNITTLNPPSGISNTNSIGFIKWTLTGGSFTISGINAALVGWCDLTGLTNTQWLIQAFIYDGTTYFGNGCVDNTGKITLPGSTSGFWTMQAAAIASGGIRFPAGSTDFTATGGTSQVVKQVSAAAPFTVGRLACADLSDAGAGCSSAGGGNITQVFVARAAICNGGLGTITDLSFTGTTFTAVCRAGVNNNIGTATAIPLTGGSFFVNIPIPGDWDTTIQPWVKVFWDSGGVNTSGTVIWTTAEGCYKSDGTTSIDPAYVAEPAMATQTITAADRGWAQSAQLVRITSGNNCVPGGTIILKVTLSGSATTVIELYSINVTFSRTNAAQAN